MSTHAETRDRLIVALGSGSVAEAEALVGRLGDTVTFYKVGMELAYCGGLGLVERLVGEGKHVFLDLKLHDIDTVVARATAQVGRLGVRFLTVHAYPQTMRAARRGAEGTELAVLGVTVLTSYDDADLAEAGYVHAADALVARRAAQARKIGLAGAILSPRELLATREACGPDFLLVTPGIRPGGVVAGDQKRVTTPGDAIRAGADHLVVGRPITEASDPQEAAEAILAEIEAAEGSVT